MSGRMLRYTAGAGYTDLGVQFKNPGPKGTTGCIGPKGITGATGPTGPRGVTVFGGPKGATGPSEIPSGFSGNSGTTIDLTEIPQEISTINIITEYSGHLWSTASLEFLNTKNTEYLVKSYMVIDGITGSNMLCYLPKKTGSLDIYSNITLQQRTTVQVPPGTYTAKVYSYSDVAGVKLTHCDLFGMGHLA